MGIKILIILACVPLYVVNAFCDKFVSGKSGNTHNTTYNCIKFFICCLCMIPILFIGNPPALALGSLLCGIVCGLMYAVSKTVMLKGYAATSVAFMTLCHSAGMIVPCVLGHFLWSEHLSFLSLTGIFITIVAIMLLKDAKSAGNKVTASGILFGIIIFFTSAGVMVTQKIMGIYFPEQSVGLYNLYSFLVAALILCFFAKPRQFISDGTNSKKAVGFCALGSAVSLSVISFVMTELASGIPSVILFPLFNGLGIIFVCVGSVFAFHEKLNCRKIWGLILGILGLYIINL